jgi:hypothetical protein
MIRRPHDVADHRIQPDVGLGQRLLDPLDIAGLLAHQLLAGAHQRAQVMESLVGDEARLDQSERRQVRDPHRIVHVGLAAGDRFDVAGVGDDQRERALVQYLPDRHPIDPGRLHRDQRALTGCQPIPQRFEPGGRRLERPTFPLRLAVAHQPHASHDAVLVHVQTRYPFVDHFHHRLPSRGRRQGRLKNTKADKQAPGRRRPLAQVRIIKASRVQLATEFADIREQPTSCRRQPDTIRFAPPPGTRFIHQGRPKAGANSQ